MKVLKDTKNLKEIKNLHFKKLKEKRYGGKYSVRTDKSYQIIFSIDKDFLAEMPVIEEITNHYSTN